MRFLHFAALATTALQAIAQDSSSPVDDEPPQTPNVNVQISTSFPSSEIFGVKLVNGAPTTALLSITNSEPAPVSVLFIGGSLWTSNALPVAPSSKNPSGGPQIIRNLTTTRYDVEIPAGESESITYKFATELQPQELKLNLAVVVKDSEGVPYTLPAFNETVAVVEPDTSIFDPQILFLYLFLLSLFTATCYFIYKTWISTLFPQKKRSNIPGKDALRAKKSTHGTKKVDPTEQVGVVGADGPAVASGAKAYDESWIPAGHLQRPEARRVKSGNRPK
ncbi:MAG: hypothetical protein Q9222_000460, partial [Ikaeria aurantiellina]